MTGHAGPVEMGACSHERSHILDSKWHGGGYATQVSRQIFCDRCRLQRWLDVEVALALAQADLQIIPAEAALEIQRAAALGIDPREITEGVARTGHSLV